MWKIQNKCSILSEKVEILGAFGAFHLLILVNFVWTVTSELVKVWKDVIGHRGIRNSIFFVRLFLLYNIVFIRKFIQNQIKTNLLYRILGYLMLACFKPEIWIFIKVWKVILGSRSIRDSNWNIFYLKLFFLYNIVFIKTSL